MQTVKNKLAIKTIGYVLATDPFHDHKAWSGTIYKVREAIENAGFNVVWIPVRLSLLHNLYVKLSVFRYGHLVSRNMDNVVVRLRSGGVNLSDEASIDYYFFLGEDKESTFRWKIYRTGRKCFTVICG